MQKGPRAAGGILAAALLGWSAASGQVNGYLSSLQGFNTNPLYNYAEQSDQLNQSYLELNWNTREGLSRGRVGYIGSLVLFNQIRERTYYEHFLVGEYSRAYPRAKYAPGEDEPPPLETLYANLLTLQAKAGARHDRQPFIAYDNVSAVGTASYKVMPSRGSFVTFTNELGYRGYPNVQELSNILDLLTVKGGGSLGGAVTGSLLAQIGMKHFAHSAVDTVYGDDGLSSGVVVNPTSANAFLLAAGAEILIPWSTGSFTATPVMRFNLTDSARYVAQFANTLGLNEDIYNDFFSYEGPEIKLTLRQTLPLGIALVLSGEYARRKFLAPAFDLAGNSLGSNRVDTRLSGELYASRYVEIGGNFGIDLVLAGTLVSNRSNDIYNDYVVRSIAFGLGLGF
jgi:hypothetical protein